MFRDEDNRVRFTIEGVAGGETTYSVLVAQEENTYNCAIRNKYKEVEKYEAISYCCGRIMETID